MHWAPRSRPGRIVAEVGTPAAAGTFAGTRFAVGALIGLAVATAVGLLINPRYAVGAGWCCGCIVWVLWIWLPLGRLNPSQTRAHAVREDSSRGTVDLLVVLAALISLGAVGYYLAQASKAGGADRIIVTVLGIATIALSWLLIHSTFALRYARLYYSDDVRGIDFNSQDDPDYRDFAYFAFNLGMTYQVSDTSVSDKQIRRTVLRHCLLSFVFGVVILGAAINIIAGLG